MVGLMKAGTPGVSFSNVHNQPKTDIQNYFGFQMSFKKSINTRTFLDTILL